jgi:hypothetical protein
MRARTARRHGHRDFGPPRLISVRQSEAIFNVAEYGLLDALTRLAGVPGLRVARWSPQREEQALAWVTA